MEAEDETFFLNHLKKNQYIQTRMGVVDTIFDAHIDQNPEIYMKRKPNELKQFLVKRSQLRLARRTMELEVREKRKLQIDRINQRSKIRATDASDFDATFRTNEQD